MLEVKNLVKVYKTKGGVETKALDGVSVNFPETGLVFLLGKSGSGKSTLLNMIGGLDRPDSGEIVVKGRSSKDFSQADFDSYRNTYIGFIFQEYNVLNEFNIEQNISLALQLQGKKNDRDAVNALLKEVDLEGFNKRKPNTLSGGQKQRIAIARALIKQPEIIMADEPTGALDSNTGKQVLETLKRLSKKKLVIIVSHDQDFAEEYGDRIIELKDGKIISDKSKEFVAPKAINEKMQIINGNIIDIKKGSDLSEADFKQLYQMIKKQDKEVLISTGEDNIKATKKAIRVSDSGHGERFSDTKAVEVKKYDGKQTKFIRSHMPFSRSFKMGASGLKTKPIRLVFTILLSVVSFTMFGVASTLMLYDPAYSLATAMENSDRKSEGIAKQYKYKYQQYQVNRKTGERTPYGEPEKRTYKNYTYFGEQEYKDLNAANNNRFIGVFTLNQLNSNRFEADLEAFRFSGIEVKDESKGKSFYYCNYFTGLSDGDASFFSNNGYQLTGKHPEKEDEIAISNYHFDLIKQSEVFGVLNSPNDILNKTLSFPVRTKNYSEKTLKMKIVGVYDFGPLSTKFNDLLTERQASVSPTDRENMEKNFKAYLGTSLYTTGYVSPSFYDKYGFVYDDNNRGSHVEPTYLKGFSWIENEPDPAWKINEDDRRNAYTIEALKSNSGVDYYDLGFNKVSSPIDLTGDEVLLPYRSYARSKEAYKYSEVPNNMFNMLSAVRWESYVSRLNTVIDDINNRNRESTDPVVLAALRVSDNYWSYLDSGDYPDECNIDDDLATVKNDYNALYKIAGRNYYLLELDEYLRGIDLTYSSDATIQGYVDKIRDYSLDETTLNDLEDAMESYLSTYPEAPMYAMGRTVNNFAYSDNKTLIDEKAEELLPAQGTLNNVLNYLSSYRSDTDYINNLDTLLKYATNLITGEECNPKEMKPTFLKDMVVPETYSKDYKLYSKDYNDAVKEYTVKGFFDVSGGDEMAVAFTSDSIKSYIYSEGGKGGDDDIYYTGGELTDYVAPTDLKYAYLMTATDYSQAEIAALTKDMGSYNYTMTNAIFTEANGWTETIEELQLIFLIIGGVTGGLSALLLLNFISVSITSKNKDIGILRAVGARGSDVFKIFFSESSIIAAICFVISAIAGGIVCFYLNNMVKATPIGIGLLNYGVINVLLILGISVVISFIATFIPVMIASKKPPVEAIRAL